ncbi:hypothetical protein M3Y99_01547800 [Aphelenchoides fujianensis]|nr:hypothetical protein M3Y99_01547800 [Aphelenchoides fujianensis]
MEAPSRPRAYKRTIGASCKQRPSIHRFRSLMSVDNLDAKSKPHDSFFTPVPAQRASVCASFTLPRKLALGSGDSPRSPGLVSQHSSVGSLGSRSMSSHHLVAQHSTPPMATSVSTLTLRTKSPSQTTVDLDVDSVLASLSTNPPSASANLPTDSGMNTLAKFPPSSPDALSAHTTPTTPLAEQPEDATPTADAQDAMVTSVNAKTASLANKLSRSFFDLTQGSSDRLAKWKSKLQQYGQQQRQRSTEKESASPGRRMASLDGSVPANDVDFRAEPTAKPRRPVPPRPLHTSRSATNALTHGLSLESSMPPGRQQAPPVTNTLPKSLHKSASVRDVDLPPGNRSSRVSSPPSVMEHRTLKQRENFASGRRTPPDPLHMQSLHELVQSIEGLQQNSNTATKKLRNSSSTIGSTRGALSQDSGDMELPPPARITPYSGVKPQDNGIIRPIAFRPVAQNKRPSDRHSSNSPDGMLPFYNKSGMSIEQHKQALKDHSRSIGNLHNLSAPRSRHPLHQPSTSSSSQLFAGKSIGSLPTADENDYDVVPEYIERNDQNRSETYSALHAFNQPQHHRAHSQNAPNVRNPPTYFTALNGGSTTTSSQFTSSSSTSSTNSPPSSTALKKSISGSQQNLPRQSNGQHITPSPSDSGIVDYESLIRDKENELHSVRCAMEQNENYREQVADLKQKLANAQQGENALRKQLRQSDEHRQQLQKTVQGLNDEKLGMQRQVVKIERELQALRTRLDNQHPCESCRRSQLQQTQSIYENNAQSKPEPSADRELRSEVEGLRGEICSLRDQLNQQVQMFSEERRRWGNNLVDSTQLNNNLPKPTAFNGYAQHRSLSEKRPLLSVDRLI